MQPQANTRDNGIVSRLGLNAKALGVESLSHVQEDFDVIGIDELHMFPETDSKHIRDWVHAGKHVFVSALDLDYRGAIPPIVQRLYELAPDVTIAKQAVCDVCHDFTAHFSQIVHNGKPITEGLPLITLDDGSYDFQARCRKCFVRA